MAQYRTSRVFDVIFISILAGLLWLSYINRIAVNDWFYFLRYEPSAMTVQVAKDASFNGSGRNLFYRTNPTFASIEFINAKCDLERLGCLDEKGNVFILDVPGKHDQTVVTAAHELLHMAYRRLSQAKKDELAPFIDDAILTNASAISEELSGNSSDEDRRDEAHSLLGTEYTGLSAELEEHYSQYFTDRSLIVSVYERSQQ